MNDTNEDRESVKNVTAIAIVVATIAVASVVMSVGATPADTNQQAVPDSDTDAVLDAMWAEGIDIRENDKMVPATVVVEVNGTDYIAPGWAVDEWTDPNGTIVTNDAFIDNVWILDR